MSTDKTIQRDVLKSLADALGDEAPSIGVAVDDASILLSGDVHSDRTRAIAVQAAHRVPGVSTVRDDITVVVSFPTGLRSASTNREVRNAIDWATHAPDSVRAEIWASTVVLTGTVRSELERETVAHTVRLAAGVGRVDDRIRVAEPDSGNASTPREPAKPRLSAPASWGQP